MADWAVAVALAALVALATLVTRLTLDYAQRSGLLDVPNARSSHTIVTPRGGGLGFVLAYLAALVGAAMAWPGQPELWLALGGSVAVALVGWRDDRRHVAPAARLAVHGAAAVWALAWLGGIPHLTVGGTGIALGMLGYPLGVLLLVWLVNLFNFMDGSDGLAASEAAFVAGAGGALAWAVGDFPLAWAAAALAACCTGFLVWNRPPARIFMGDVGSGFLGFCIGVLALAGELRGSLPLLVWLLLAALFLGDATLTLLRRMLRREPWWKAHREHAYQRLIARGWSHARVLMGLWACNLLVLLPLALLAAAEPGWAPAAAGAAGVGVAVLWVVVRAVDSRQ